MMRNAEGKFESEPLADRLARLIDKRGPDECWPWLGRIGKNGYPVIRDGDKFAYAHRRSYELANGVALPPEVKVRHRCDNPPCCNPDHLIEGTQAQNVQDMVQRGRARKTALPCNVLHAILNDTRSQRKIAAAFGVDQATVSRIKNGHGSYAI